MIHTADVIECILYMPSIILGLGQNKMGKEKKSKIKVGVLMEFTF